MNYGLCLPKGNIFLTFKDNKKENVENCDLTTMDEFEEELDYLFSHGYDKNNIIMAEYIENQYTLFTIMWKR